MTRLSSPMSFPFRKQPWKALYIIYFGVSTLFVRLPFWLVKYAFPSNRPRRSWSLKQTLSVRGLEALVRLIYTKIGLPTPRDPRTLESVDGFVWVDGVGPELVVGRVAATAKINGVAPARICGFWTGDCGADGRYGQAASTGEKVLYMLHGGGYITGSANPKTDPSSRTGPLLAHTTIRRTFALEYRLCSAAPYPAANPFPASLLDAVAGYQYLVRDLGFVPGNILVAGLSSGGHLAANLVLYLAQEHLLSMPRGLLLMSPSLDLARTHTGPTYSMERNRNADITGPLVRTGYSARALRGALPMGDLATDPFLSPGSLALADTRGLFKDFPPTCILAGEAELSLSPMQTVRDRLVADMGDERVRYLEYADANHIFLAMPVFPVQRDQAYRDVGRWVSDLFES
ncbi:alpha/beta-hydrolase, partial [Mycena galericulata]